MPRVELGSKLMTTETSTYIVHLYSHKTLQIDKIRFYQPDLISFTDSSESNKLSHLSVAYLLSGEKRHCKQTGCL